MKGGAAYQDWGAGGQGLCGEMQGFGGSGCKPWDGPADGDNSLKLSVGVEKVPEKNETATDFRL